MGNPLPKNNNDSRIDWDKQKEFEFEFELGLAPSVDLSVLQKIKMEKYLINVDDKLLNDQIKDLSRRYGKMSEANVTTEDDFINGIFQEVDKKIRTS